MMIVLIVMGAIVWLGCGAVSYSLMRRDNRKKGWAWTVKDRAIFLPGSIIFGPIAILASLITICVFSSDDRPAKW